MSGDINTLNEAQLRSLVPARCFQPSTVRSLAYLGFDFAVLAALYTMLANASSWWIEAPVIFLIGTFCWSLFVVGHEAGHGAFSKSRLVNTLAGLVAHSPLLVPYRGWQRSHALHHAKAGHLREEEVFRTTHKGEDTLFRKVLYRSGIFLLIGWPIYKLGLRNPTTLSPIRGSHYLPTSRLYASSVRWSWYASLMLCLAFATFYGWVWYEFGWIVFAKYILAPYMVYGTWLTFVTYMQHVSPEVPVYDEGDWSRLKGALATVDRNYGPFNWITHNIGNLHVVHHLWSTIPHYRLKEATEAIRPALGEHYIRSDRFVLFDFIRTMAHCHFVEAADGHETYRSSYPFVKPRARREEPPVAMAAE